MGMKTGTKISFNLTWLTLIFIILKLIGVINWGWIWVFSPTWIPFALMIAVFVLYLLIPLLSFIIVALFEKIKKK